MGISGGGGGAAAPHLIGGAQHLPDTLANLNARVTDANLDDTGTARVPTAHEGSHRPAGADALVQVPGHLHAGVAGDGGQFNHANLAAVGVDDHHAQSHEVLHRPGGGDALTQVPDHAHAGVAGDGAQISGVAALTNVLDHAHAGVAGDGAQIGFGAFSEAGQAQGDIMTRGAAAWQRLAAGVAGRFLRTAGAGADPTWAVPAGAGFYDAYVCVRDKKNQNTDGGTFTLGAQRTRDINDEQADTGGICAIAANQITLAAGTYQCMIRCPAWSVGNHQARLYNVSDTAILIIGSSTVSAAADEQYADQTDSWIIGRFTLAAEKVLEIQHQCVATNADDGFGIAMNVDDEIYTTAIFRREA